jgi:hypothetical protein
MASCPTPEDVLGDSTEPPLALELKCNRCGSADSQRFDYAVVHPKREKCQAEGWDGVLLSRIVECPCGAVDDYVLAPRSHAKLMTAALKRTGLGKQGGGRILVAVSQLWDGTVVRRPSQALARLRELAESHPKSGEAWQRLGNSCERYGRLPEAESAWRKALEVEPKELEAAYSLATLLGERGQWPEAFGFLRTALALLPQDRGLDPDFRRQVGHSLVAMLRDLLDVTDEPLALEAVWRGGKLKDSMLVHVSAVDLRKVENWEGLADFLVDPEVLGLGLTPTLPTDDPTQLESRLAGELGMPANLIERPPRPPGGRVRLGTILSLE